MKYLWLLVIVLITALPVNADCVGLEVSGTLFKGTPLETIVDHEVIAFGNIINLGEGKIVTAGHCADMLSILDSYPDLEGDLYVYMGLTYERYEVFTIHRADGDISLLETNVPGKFPVDKLVPHYVTPLPRYVYQYYDWIGVYPRILLEGKILTGPLHFDGFGIVQLMSMDVCGGCSGGAVRLLDGRVVGMTVAERTDGGISIMVPSYEILRFVKECGF